jgi:DNA-binding FadR family transcriptional regulator
VTGDEPLRPLPRAVPHVAADALRVPKAADVLAEHLRRRVLEGDLVAGTMLPSERELAEQSGLGRSSVREALRTLEVQGFVRTRPGRGGGTRVAIPTAGELARSVELFIKGNGLRLQSVLEVRELLEPACAALAAERRTPEDLAALREINARMAGAAEHDSPAYLRANVDWHLRVAQAGGNELFAGFMLAVAESVRAGTDLRKLDAPAVRAAAVHAHERIMAAIADGDAARARRRMDAHVRAYKALVGDPAVLPA